MFIIENKIDFIKKKPNKTEKKHTKTNLKKVGTGTLQETLDMGFREEGALELRSSTEELYFMDPTQKTEEAKIQQQQQQQTQQQQQVS